jgi:hypothetical protein
MTSKNCSSAPIKTRSAEDMGFLDKKMTLRAIAQNVNQGQPTTYDPRGKTPDSKTPPTSRNTHLLERLAATHVQNSSPP